eukprot:TRINITY_DN4099_c1_g1_i1.p1 TRINITY_DN4099_c1_g1~~TRINITY_DN4099_c1_g1_i1.p1  ORF type:complete len:382 (-),score=112.80 TRINITY_DN4099_c1_g1_i1:180-1280(-)
MVNAHFPMFACLCFPSNTRAQETIVIVGGGGGSAKTGILNLLVVFRLKKGSLSLEKAFEYGLECSASHVANHENTIVCGNGAQLTLLTLDETNWKFECIGSVEAVDASEDAEIKALKFSRNGKTLISGGSDGKLRVWKVGKGGLVESRIIQRKDSQAHCEIVDADIANDTSKLAVNYSNGDCIIYDLLLTTKVLQIISNKKDNTQFPPEWTGYKIRGCRFGKANELFLGVMKPRNSSYLAVWEVYGEQIVDFVVVTKGYHHTSMAISSDEDNNFVAIGTSQGTTVVVKVADNSLKILSTIKKPDGFSVVVNRGSASKELLWQHGLPVSSIGFALGDSEETNRLVSVSPDSICMVLPFRKSAGIHIM